MMHLMPEFFENLFQPRSVAIVGTSQDPQKWGFHILLNVLKGQYTGRVFAVNPRGSEILGVRVYPSIAQIPEPVDLAVLVAPPADIMKILGDCGQKGINAAIVITAGFGELGENGRAIQDEMVRLARALGIRLVGPNCQGVVSPDPFRLYAQMPSFFPPAGGVSFVSQSGNVITSLLSLSVNQGMGLRHVISSGNEADLTTIDFLESFLADPGTKVILSYLEGVREGRDFFRRIRPVAKKKPLLMLKAGQTEAGVKAAKSHTGSLSGVDPLFNGLCRQAGIIRLETIEEMVDLALALSTQPLPRGRRVGIITLGGGWGVLGADYCVKAGLIVEDLPEELIRALDQVLPPWWNRMNPIDTVAGYRKGDILQTLELFLQSDRFDGVLILGFGWRVARGSLLKAEAKDPGDPMARAGEDWIAEDMQSFDAFPGLIQRYGKPILLASDVLHRIPGYPQSFRNKKLAGYTSLHRVVRAYAGLVERYAFLQGQNRPARKRP